MKVLPLYFTVFALLLNMPKSQAVIRGAELPIEQVSTLRVKIPIARRARGGGLNIYDGYCSSVVVGTKPLTLLLAAHCFMGAYVTGKPGDPEIEVDLSQIGSHQKLKIKDVAMSDQFWKSDLPGVGNDTSYDLAFMVFEDNLDHPKIKPIKISLNSSTTKSALICGYGYASDETKPSLPRCAEKKFKDFEKTEQFLPVKYKNLDQVAYVKSQSIEVPFSNMQKRNTFSVSRVDVKGDYSLAEPMPKTMDSGGPWFSKDEKTGELFVTAITSHVKLFFQLSREWPFLKDMTQENKADYPLAAYGVRLDTKEAREVIDEALAAGADIRLKD